MTDHNEAPDTMAAVTQPFVEFWSTYLQQSEQITRSMLAGLNGGADPQAWKRRWLDAVSQSIDAALRSPAFLEAMRQNTDATIKAKNNMNDLCKEVARNTGVPTASDVSGVFERLHSFEEAILKELGKIGKRLDTIEEKVDRSLKKKKDKEKER